jgi:hypothetical protein
MSEEKKPVFTTKPTPPVIEMGTVEVVELADAAASSDGLVHQILANRYTAEMNGDKEAADAATAQLAELGYR